MKGKNGETGGGGRVEIKLGREKLRRNIRRDRYRKSVTGCYRLFMRESLNNDGKKGPRGGQGDRIPPNEARVDGKDACARLYDNNLGLNARGWNKNPLKFKFNRNKF